MVTCACETCVITVQIAPVPSHGNSHRKRPNAGFASPDATSQKGYKLTTAAGSNERTSCAAGTLAGAGVLSV
eukprot:scaffold19179_cov35-Tisochrysis_lutea.AAC.3